MQSNLFFKILRAALGLPFAIDENADFSNVSPETWKEFFVFAQKQSLLGIAFAGVCNLKIELPRKVYLGWSMRVEAIRGLNARMNAAAVKLTDLFTAQGRSTAIFKGQANARLYPDPALRQPGDIDIWVSGGRTSVLKLLADLNFPKDPDVSEIHAHVPEEMFGVPVEVHFITGGGVYDPFANRRLRAFLDAQVLKSRKVEDGFFVPPMEFALCMQLAHVYRHFLGLGIGLRQLMDYCVLLQNATAQERDAVSGQIKSFGLLHIASAVMWILGECFGLPPEKMLCKPNASCGKMLYDEIMEGGNFGSHAKRKKGSVFMWWLKNRLRLVRLLPFDFCGVGWYLLQYWGKFACYIPLRLRLFVKFSRQRKNSQSIRK